jgi:surface carbohydrate biosynthesis protein
LTASEKPFLLIPIETKVREFDAKVLQACAAAEIGFRVLLGEQNSFIRRLAALPPGFYLDKDVSGPKVKAFARLRRLGYRPVAWCEEGLVYRNRDSYLRERVAPGAFDMTSAFFAWGEVQGRDVAARVGDGAAKIHLTGNPRFDLLRPEFRALHEPAASALRARHGPFLLINTNFARYNHFFGREKSIDILRTRGAIRTAQEEVFHRGWVDFIAQVFDAFVDLAPRLAAAFPNLKIVLRPHPSENHDTWRRIAAGVPNLEVIHEGSVIPWLLAAEASIHNSCTTGLEAALLGRPVFAYRPAISETYDSFLPNRVSAQAHDFEQLREQLAALASGTHATPISSDPAVRQDVARYVASIDGPLASDRIAKVLASLDRTEDLRPGGILVPRLVDRGERTLRAVARHALAPFRQTGAYARQKFSGLAAEEVRARVEALRQLSGRFGDVGVRAGPAGSVLLQRG